MVKKKNRWLWPVIGAGVLLLLAVRQLPLYESAEAQPFEGPYWYNPYEQVNGAGRWLRANFHAHSMPGLCHKRQKNTVADVLQTYDSLGYDVIGISDYQHITLKHGVWENERTGRSMLLIPAYEHEYNIRKTHQG